MYSDIFIITIAYASGFFLNSVRSVHAWGFRFQNQTRSLAADSKLLAVFNISFEMMFAKLWEDIFPLLLSVHRHVSAGKALLQWQSAGNKIKR